MNEIMLPQSVRIFSPWKRTLVCLAYLFVVNLLSGFIAVRLDYPSLFGGDTAFAEYALPLPFTYALSHIPSMLVFSVLLLALGQWQNKSIKIFRVFCLSLFILLFLELDAKNPFILFGKVDTLFAFLFSLIMAPPTKASNPILVRMLKITAGGITLFLGAVALSLWQHRTPVVEITAYSDGVFELQSITVLADFRKTLEFRVLLNDELSEQDVCAAGQKLATALLTDYPFDINYEKIVYLYFNPPAQEQIGNLIEIGEISLNEQDREDGELYPCYVDLDFSNFQGAETIPLI